MIFRFSGVLLRFVGFQKEMKIEAATLAEALTGLMAQVPTLKPVLMDGAGSVRKTHRIFLNGEQLTTLDDNLKLEATDCLEIITAIAGG
jgi:molybdopterin synthase sulfur carrier subunit